MRKVDIWSNESIMKAKGEELFIIKKTAGREAFKKFCKKKGISEAYGNRFIQVAKGTRATATGTQSDKLTQD